MKKSDREYWRLKNLAGYATISGDKDARAQAEKKIETLLKKVKVKDDN